MKYAENSLAGELRFALPSSDLQASENGLTQAVGNSWSFSSVPSNQKPFISVIIPVYKSSEILPELIRRTEAVLVALANDFEIVLVNDGSPDNSWETIQRLVQQHPKTRGINLMRNYGQHNALLCGVRSAKFEYVVTMDDDLQHPPEEIHKLLVKINEGFDVVYGYPQEQQHGLLRNVASEVTKMALRTSMGSRTARRVSAFRAFRTCTRDAFRDFHGPFVSIDVLLTWASTRFTAIPVSHAPLASGLSNYTFGKLFTHAMNMMTGFSTLPLQIANLLGLLCTGFGALILAYVVGRYFIYGTSVPGFTFLASIISIFAGAQLVALGIIGEYLARMHFRMLDRPSYTVLTAAVHSNGNPA